MFNLHGVFYDGEGGTGATGATGAGGDSGAGAGAGAAGASPVGGAAGTSPASPFSIPADYDVRALLPEDIRNHKSLEKFTAKGPAFFEALARSNVAAQALIGTDPNELVKLPPADKMTTEERGKVLQRLGLPATPEGYALKPLAKAVEGMGHDQPLAQWFQKAAADLKMFPDQAQTLYEGFSAQMAEAMTLQANQSAARDQGNVDTLQRELGKAFDGEVQAARHGAMKLGGQELIDRLNAAGLGTDPVLFKAMAKYGKYVSETGGVGDKTGGFRTGLSPADAKSQANSLLRQAMEVMDKDQGKARELNRQAQEILASAVKG